MMWNMVADCESGDTDWTFTTNVPGPSRSTTRRWLDHRDPDPGFRQDCSQPIMEDQLRCVSVRHCTGQRGGWNSVPVERGCWKDWGEGQGQARPHCDAEQEQADQENTPPPQKCRWGTWSGARTLAYGNWAHIAEHPPEAVLHLETQVDVVWPDCPADLADFVPDGILIVQHGLQDLRRVQVPLRIIIFEFGRCYTIELQELSKVGMDKRAQYQGLQRFLRLLFPDMEVSNLTFILSTLGVLPQSSWIEMCTELGFSEAQTARIQTIGMRACVVAAHRLNNV
eukprot:617254-Rhodomonas_salina.1